MKGTLHKTIKGEWVVRVVSEETPKCDTIVEHGKQYPLHPYDKVDDDDEGGEVEFKIVYFWETGMEMEQAFKVAELFKPVRPKKINLEEMPKEEWEEVRNPAYKHFNIDLEYPELTLKGEVHSLSALPQTNSITFSLKNNEPVIVMDEVGFRYKGELIEDAGEIYKLFKEYLTDAKQ
jgi:hypothetical protein